jgi:hypothetical protein
MHISEILNFELIKCHSDSDFTCRRQVKSGEESQFGEILMAASEINLYRFFASLRMTYENLLCK